MKNLKKWATNPWVMLPASIVLVYFASLVLSFMPKEAWYAFPTVTMVVIGTIAACVWTVFLLVGILDD